MFEGAIVTVLLGFNLYIHWLGSIIGGVLESTFTLDYSVGVNHLYPGYTSSHSNAASTASLHHSNGSLIASPYIESTHSGSTAVRILRRPFQCF